MYELLSQEAVEVLMLAQEEAVWAGLDSVLLEHVLWAVFAMSDASDVADIRKLSCLEDELAALLLSHQRDFILGTPQQAENLKWPTELQIVFSAACEFAARTGSPNISPDHILWALLGEPADRITELLNAVSIDGSKLRRQIESGEIADKKSKVEPRHNREIASIRRTIRAWHRRLVAAQGNGQVEKALYATSLAAQWQMELSRKAG